MSIPAPEEVGRLMAVADERFQPFIALHAFAGPRVVPAGDGDSALTRSVSTEEAGRHRQM